MQTRIVVEGTTRVEVPVPDESAAFPPSTAPVFYNPRMELSRDIGVAVAAAFANGRELVYADVLAASGIRGLRIAREAGLQAVLNDWNPMAFLLIQRNIELNSLVERCEACNKNANMLLQERSFDILDLDPFGSPAPYLDSACRSAKEMLCITATDTAPLCGAHRKAGIRTYGAFPLKTEYYPEIGIRILLGALVRSLAKYDKAMAPLLSYSYEHYYRIYARVSKSAKEADSCMESLGYISHCFNCSSRNWKPGLAVFFEEKCSLCGHPNNLAGPLWLGELHDEKFCESVLTEIRSHSLGKKAEAAKIVLSCRDELDIPTYYDYHKICKSMGVSPMATSVLIKTLQRRGFTASRTHFSGTSFKTNASIREIRQILAVSS